MADLPVNSEPQTPGPGHIVYGFLAAAACNVAALVLSAGLIMLFVGIYLVAGFGLIQFFWLVPLWMIYRKQGKTESAKGVLIVAGITVLLSAACWSSLDRAFIQGYQPKSYAPVVSPK
jgi:hypothetical protein